MDDAGPRSVLVSHAAGRLHGVDDAFGTSGLMLSPAWLLTHGSLLAPNFLEARPFLEEARKRDAQLLPVPEKLARGLRFRLHYNDGRTAVRERSCALKLLWSSGMLRRSFEDLFFGWSFDRPTKFDKSLLSIFLLLRIDGEAASDDAAEATALLREFYSNQLRGGERLGIRRGVPVEIESAPFGNAAFLESVSRGVVSNVLGREGCVILTDANAVPGCEGAPLFLVREEEPRRICGLVLAPLSWCRGEWVDYTFAADLQACLGELLRRLPTSSSAPLPTAPLYVKLADSLDRSLLVVKCASGWGTGVIVDTQRGTLLTCSHVVREAEPGARVELALPRTGRAAWARLLYRTRDGQPFDVAVLRIEAASRSRLRALGYRALELASDAARRGGLALTAGFPFFAASAPASCSLGVVSRVTEAMLQTTCCVQSGASGGPVLDCATGRLIGLVVSNAVSASGSGALYPRFNMAVPATVLRGPLLEFQRTGDVKALQALSTTDPKALETWNFYLTPKSNL